MTQHKIDIRSNLARDEHQATCDCGWVGRSFSDKNDAAHDGDEHVLAMSRSED